MKPKDCPCHSGLRYAACCGPAHEGREPATPEALMRSRYAAFALGLGEYLVRTLASSHPDARLPAKDLARELSRAKSTQRFLGLRILAAREDEKGGAVWFDAKIFSRGVDLSFVELSTFVREGGGFRYLSGLMAPRAALPAGWEGAGEAAFVETAKGLEKGR